MKNVQCSKKKCENYYGGDLSPLQNIAYSHNQDVLNQYQTTSYRLVLVNYLYLPGHKQHDMNSVPVA